MPHVYGLSGFWFSRSFAGGKPLNLLDMERCRRFIRRRSIYRFFGKMMFLLFIRSQFWGSLHCHFFPFLESFASQDGACPHVWAGAEAGLCTTAAGAAWTSPGDTWWRRQGKRWIRNTWAHTNMDSCKTLTYAVTVLSCYRFELSRHDLQSKYI